MVLMAMCDADYRLTRVDIGGRGRRSDAGLWEESALHESIRGGDFPMPPSRRLPGGWAVTPPVIVGDGIFTLGPHLMKPFPGQNLADHLQIFNYR